MLAGRWRGVLAAIVVAMQFCVHAESSNIARGKTLRLVSDDFELPVAIVPDPRHAGHIFIAERSGLILSLDTKSKEVAEAIDIEDLIGRASPRGLLGIATNRSQRDTQLFVSYLDPHGDLVVGRFSLANEPTPLTEESMSVVVKIARLSVNALGSAITVGPDGLLYIGTYDGEGATSASTHTAQLPQTLLGKVIRIKPGEKVGYSTPTDNPFVKQQNFQPEIWALGFRSPEALIFSEDTRQLFVLDNNIRNLEINLVEPGKNYGWDTVEGGECREHGCSIDSFTSPVLMLPKASSTSRLVGGFVYGGGLHPDLDHSLIFAETTSGTLFSASQAGPQGWTHNAVARIDNGSITALGIGTAGDIYVATDRGELFVLQSGRNA
jgi:glucose/arabinose dehydrogenase